METNATATHTRQTDGHTTCGLPADTVNVTFTPSLATCGGCTNRVFWSWLNKADRTPAQRRNFLTNN